MGGGIQYLGAEVQGLLLQPSVLSQHLTVLSTDFVHLYLTFVGILHTNHVASTFNIIKL